MTLTATELDPLSADPVPAGWDEFVAGQRLTGQWDARMLRAVSWCSQSQSSMVLVRDGSRREPVAVFYARHLGARDPRRFAEAGRVGALGVTECRLAPTLSGAGMAFAAGLDLAGRREAVLAFQRAVRRRAGAALHPVVYRGLPESMLSVLPAGSRVIHRGREMLLDNRWEDVSDYLASLPGRWGARIRRIHAAVRQDATVRQELVDAIDPAQAVWLADLVRRRRRYRWEIFAPYPAVYFDHLNRIPDWRYLTYRDRDGRLLAFAAMYDDGDSLYSGVWGYRGGVDGSRRDLYFDAYPRMVDLMITLGRRRLLLGVGMAEMKARFGARSEPRYGVLSVLTRAATGAGRAVPAGPPTHPAATADARVGRAGTRKVGSRPAGGGAGSPARPVPPACRQCGDTSTVRLRRPGTRAVRYGCHRCGAVGRADPTAARPATGQRPERGDAATADLAEVLPAPMIEWLNSRLKRPVTLQRLEKGVLNELYRVWDAHVAELSPRQREALTQPGRPTPTSGLPGFTAVVKALNATCYRSDLAVLRLAGPPEPGREVWCQAVWERVELTRRWLALRGGDECWIRQVPEAGMVPADPDAVAAVLTALRTGAPVGRDARAVVLAALFGTARGPRVADLLAVYGTDRLVTALEAYLAAGTRQLREEALARLSAAPAFPAAPTLPAAS